MDFFSYSIGKGFKKLKQTKLLKDLSNTMIQRPRTTLAQRRPVKVFYQRRCSWKQLFCNVTSWSCGQNFWKLHVKELIFEVVASYSETLLKMSSLTWIFKNFDEEVQDTFFQITRRRLWLKLFFISLLSGGNLWRNQVKNLFY